MAHPWLHMDCPGGNTKGEIVFKLSPPMLARKVHPSLNSTLLFISGHAAPAHPFSSLLGISHMSPRSDGPFALPVDKPDQWLFSPSRGSSSAPCSAFSSLLKAYPRCQQSTPNSGPLQSMIAYRFAGSQHLDSECAWKLQCDHCSCASLSADGNCHVRIRVNRYPAHFIRDILEEPLMGAGRHWARRSRSSSFSNMMEISSCSPGRSGRSRHTKAMSS